MLGFVVIGGMLLLLLIWFYYDCQVSGQGDCNIFLQVEIEKVKEQNKEIECLDCQKDCLLVWKKVIEELQVKCLQMVYLFDVLVWIIFDGVVFIVLKQEGDIFILEGCMQFNVCVSVYMCNLESLGWMINLELLIIEVKVLDKEKEGVLLVGLVVDIKVLFYMFVVKVMLLVQIDLNVVVFVVLGVFDLVVDLVVLLVVLLLLVLMFVVGMLVVVLVGVFVVVLVVFVLILVDVVILVKLFGSCIVLFVLYV